MEKHENDTGHGRDRTRLRRGRLHVVLREITSNTLTHQTQHQHQQLQQQPNPISNNNNISNNINKYNEIIMKLCYYGKKQIIK